MLLQMYIYIYIYIYIFGTWPAVSSEKRTALHRFGVIVLHHEHSMSSIKDDGMENSAKWSDRFKELIVAWLHSSFVQLWPVCGLVASLRRTKKRTRSNCCRRRCAVEPAFEFSPLQAENVKLSMTPKMEISSVAGPESMR